MHVQWARFLFLEFLKGKPDGKQNHSQAQEKIWQKSARQAQLTIMTNDK